MLTLILLALGLSMDAVAVSICAGLAKPEASWSRRLRMPLAFGVFQGVMPLIGWAAGEQALAWSAAWDHWLAFALLTGIGGKMLWESRRPACDRPEGDPFAWGRLLVLALATSIDALAAGLTLSVIDVPVLVAVAVIAGATAALCLPAVLLGSRLAAGWSSRAEALGGLVLIGIGLRILIEHTAS